LNDLKIKIDNLPDCPGVYKYFNDKGKIIYIGKAKNIKSRVRSYFVKNLSSVKTKVLVSKISDIEVIVTDSEAEALILENNLIKRFKPRYNINLKDDKSYPFIRITHEPFPRVFPTRKVIKDGSKYFGPYTDVKSLRAALKTIGQVFRIRSCKLNLTKESILKRKFKVCLDYHIKKCDGMCEGFCSENDYNLIISRVIKLLNGKTESLISEMIKELEVLSDNLEFEKAADLRDKMQYLKVFSEKQKLVTASGDDKDFISFAVENKDAACSIFLVRDGKMIGNRQFSISIETDYDDSTIYNAIIMQYYFGEVDIPREIVIEASPSEIELLTEILSKKSGHRVSFVIPQIESKNKSLLKMCKENAVYQLKEKQIQRMKKEGNIPFTLAALKRDLRLSSIPKVIECYDISTLQGSDTVASQVVFAEGKPKKSNYRKYIINSIDYQDDFASMKEVITRRFKRLIDEGSSMPDLIMVDGGKGQLSSAIEALNELGLKKFNIIGLAKRLEEIYVPENPEPVIIPKTSSSLKLLQQVRDEAHRFAITFHRNRRSKRIISSELEKIKGIGEKLIGKLLSEFQDINLIKTATIEELAKVVGKAKAQIVYNYYHEIQND